MGGGMFLVFLYPPRSIWSFEQHETCVICESGDYGRFLIHVFRLNRSADT